MWHDSLTHPYVWHDSFTRVNGWFYTYESCEYMSYVTRMNESCHTYEWVMSHIWMSHVIHMNESRRAWNESCRTYEWVMSQVWMSHVTHINRAHWPMPTATNARVMSHVWMSHVARMNESCRTYQQGILDYANGNKYDGAWVNNRRHGVGRLVSIQYISIYICISSVYIYIYTHIYM